MTKVVILLLAAGLLVLSVAACGSGAMSSTHAASATKSSASAPASATKSDRVLISGYDFHPPTVTVAPGARLTFVNHDQTAHTATATKGAFDSGTIAAGASRTVRVSKAGTYTYFCQFHAFMHATVIVR
ncbi:MAG: cupredoxin domain-containing protein [Actinomycetota bacterium]|nr:cupredoxin domain-containing protein [Actinomycetota bacterium]